MPVLNARGDILAGIDGTVSLNGVPVVALHGITAGGWRFLLEDVIAGQAFIDGAWALWQVDRRGGFETLSRLDPAGANEFRAGAGEWLAYLTPPSVRGTIPNATGEGLGLYDVGRDGIGVVKDHHGAERGLRVVFPSGVELPYLDDTFIAYQDGRLLSVAPSGLMLTDVARAEADAIPDLGVRGGRICARNGRVFHVFYWRGYTVVQELGGYLGWPVRFSEHDFNPDVVAINDRDLVVATSASGGERPHEIQRYTIDVTSGAIDLRQLYPPVMMPPVSDVAAIGRPAFVGPYQFNTFGRRAR